MGDQGGGGAGGEANVCQLAAEAGDVLFAFRDFFVEPGEFGVFVDKPRQRDHVFRTADHEGGGFGFGFAIREDADAVEAAQREQAAFLGGKVASGVIVQAADDERQRFAGGDVHVGADFAYAEQGFLQPGDFGVGLRVFAVACRRVGLGHEGVARCTE